MEKWKSGKVKVDQWKSGQVKVENGKKSGKVEKWISES